jgi:dihydroorotate dehydrogenase (NAD+) catalytic subunit
VTRIVDIARAAKEAGTDAVTCINTVLGMAVDWRKQKPMLSNIVGGLSGPAIKPIALRCVYQVATQVGVPVIGVGGIADIDDCMEFLIAGASAIQIGTANYYDPLASIKILRELPNALEILGAKSIREIVGTLKT